MSQSDSRLRYRQDLTEDELVISRLCSGTKFIDCETDQNVMIYG